MLNKQYFLTSFNKNGVVPWYPTEDLEDGVGGGGGLFKAETETEPSTEYNVMIQFFSHIKQHHS